MSEYWRELIKNRGFSVKRIVNILEDLIFMVCKPIKETVHSSNYAALHHATYVCSYGRLRLLELMERAGAENLIYNDTDSIMFLSPRDQNPLDCEIDNFLGFLSNELNEDEEISEVTVVAPKCYAYVVKSKDSERIVRKIKGVSRNKETEEKLIYENYVSKKEEWNRNCMGEIPHSLLQSINPRSKEAELLI
ncbi:hypothetical protein PMAYCL1PPCAC_31575 [Pristionchus mayeri]|uniref:DNA-directed DNA polymerase n=1 Tax=Pristionchus mayeri TaxID=1317129 RepID=A0AAN5IER4_9BILA|nr:hypothetical protein PMAYCL1PPCAC_31575 [Pristionchus mayeri]